MKCLHLTVLYISRVYSLSASSGVYCFTTNISDNGCLCLEMSGHTSKQFLDNSYILYSGIAC